MTPGDVEGAIRMSSFSPQPGGDGEVHLRTRRKVVTARSPGQRAYMQAIRDNELVFGTGPAGTGKTYLAVACAAAELAAGKVDRIVLSRPAVEAGERLGFLPGDMKEKVDPYLRPLYDALYDVMPANLVQRGMADGHDRDRAARLHARPHPRRRLCHSRRGAEHHAAADEDVPDPPWRRQPHGGHGDPTQIDLPRGRFGARRSRQALESVEGIAHIPLHRADIVRHPLVTRIVEAYEQGGRKPPGRKG